MNLPKLDERERKMLAQSRGTPPLVIVTRLLQGRLDYVKQALTRADPLDVPRLQGRAMEIEDLLTTLTKETP